MNIREKKDWKKKENLLYNYSLNKTLTLLQIEESNGRVNLTRIKEC